MNLVLIDIELAFEIWKSQTRQKKFESTHMGLNYWDKYILICEKNSRQYSKDILFDNVLLFPEQYGNNAAIKKTKNPIRVASVKKFKNTKLLKQ